MVDYTIEATGGPTGDLPAFYPLYDDLVDELGNANNGYVSGSITPPSPGNPICIPEDVTYTSSFSTPSFQSMDGTGFKFSAEFKLNGFTTNTFSGDPILMMSISFRWIGIFTNPDGKIGIAYLNSNYIPSNTTVNLDEWYKVELVYDNGTAYLYLDDVLILTHVIGVLEYPGYSFEDNLYATNLVTGNGATGTHLNGCIRNVAVSNLNDDGGSGGGMVNVTDNAPEVFPVGYTYVTATATDESNNSASCSFYVAITDNQAPTAVCENTTVQIRPSGYYSFTDDDLLDYDQTTDNCDNFYISNASSYAVDCDDVGTTIPVTVTVSDYNGNSSNCTASITVEEGTELPGGWNHADIGTATGDAEYAPCAEDTPWTVASNGPSFGPQDKLHYAWKSLCGDGEIIARVEQVTNIGWAGLMMRENSSAGSRMVRLKTQLSNFVRREVRASPNGMINSKQLFAMGRTWLRLVKQGDFYTGYTSHNGTNWTFSFYIYNPMGTCVQVGLMAEGINPNATAVATFDNVAVIGGALPLESPAVGVEFGDVHSESLADVSLYPNPAREEVHIDLKNFSEEDLALSMVNSLGQVVRQERLQQVATTLHTIQVSDLVPGLYFIRLERSNGEVISKRLIVQ
ncbi:MAG: hypothetical protein DHS20C18_40300 [Saprospiraceae bacterium]|nr:MAG: hypothetical protein DHS20C18_40300 [Saprospiraceae bacterium]